MNINMAELQQLNDNQRLNLFIPIINSVYKRYDYMLLSSEELCKLVLKEMRKFNKNYNGNMSYNEQLRINIINLINVEIKKSLFDSSTEIIIINNYINKYFNDIMSCDVAIRKIKKFNLFLESYNYILNPDVLVEIIEKNANFSNALKLIVEKYKLNEVENIDKDYKLSFMVRTYCELNEIDIKELENDVDLESSNDDELENDINIMSNMSIFRRDIKKYPLLSAEEEKELTKKISLGDQDARDLFIASNLRLVLAIARKYVGVGLSYDDLVQEGIIGLTTAVDKYDVSKGYKFSTYATYWIKQAMTRAIFDKGRTIRIPVYLYDRLLKYQKTVSALSIDLGRTPTKKEIAQKMQLSESEITKLMELLCDTISLNSFIDEEEECELESMIPSDDSSIGQAMFNIMKLELYNFLDNINLTAREKAILILRFGLDGNGVLTLDDIGKLWNLSRERVRQINEKALYKIKKNPYVNSFALYMQNPTEALQVVEKIQNKDTNIIKYNTIYEHFNYYSRLTVDKALKMLSANEYEFIKRYYMEDNGKSIYSKINQVQCCYLSNILIPKVNNILINNKKGKVSEVENKLDNIEESDITFEKDSVDESIIDDNTIELEQNYEYDKIENEDYEEVLQLLINPAFNFVMNKLNSKEIIIVYLKFGYVSGKCFSNNAIAEFLKLDEQDVEDVIAKALFLYKNQLPLNQISSKKLIKKMID